MSVKRFFIIFIVIILIVIVVGGGYLWYQGIISKGLEISLEVPEEIKVGTPFMMSVDVINSSRNTLEDTKLLIELPNNMVFVGSSQDRILETRNLGDLGAGDSVEESFQLLALGGENTVREIKATVSYLPDSLVSRFEKSESINFSVTESSIIFDISLPRKVFSGEEFETAILYKNTSSQNFDDLRLKLNYPPTFTFKSASDEPSAGNNFWNLGSLKSGDSGRLVVKGNLVGPEGSFFELTSSLELGSLGKTYEVLKKTASISIAASPLSLRVSLNKGQDYITTIGDELTYSLDFRNNTDIGLRDIVVRAKLSGEMFNLESLRANASFNASNNTIIWNTSNNSFLGILSPGDSNSVAFTLKTKDFYPIQRLNDKNFVLKVQAEIESPTVPYGVSADKILSIAEIENKVGGLISVDAQGFYRDAASGIVNKGPWPIRVGMPTNFTVHWVVKNFSNDVTGVRIKAFLGNNVSSTGVIKSNTVSKPVYNERTKEIVWDIDRIQAGKGISNTPLEAIFQLEAIPSINQQGGPIILLQTTAWQGTDDFTGEIITGSSGEITTSSLFDPTVDSNDGIVQE